MEHFIRTAIWIVTLSGCLQAMPLTIKDFNVELMRKHVKCPADSTFYTPTNVKVNCMTAALDCFMKELNGTVIGECEDPHKYRDAAVESYEFLIKNRRDNEEGNALKDSSECVCENWSEAPFTKFLDQMEYLLQQIKNEDSA